VIRALRLIPSGHIVSFVSKAMDAAADRKTITMTIKAAHALILTADMNAIRAAHAALTAKMAKSEAAFARYDGAEVALYRVINDADRLANRDGWMR